MKTIAELPYPYKEMALVNMEIQGRKRNKNEFLDFAFTWMETIEGHDFWDLINNNSLPQLTPEIKANYPTIFGKEESKKDHAISFFNFALKRRYQQMYKSVSFETTEQLYEIFINEKQPL